VHYFCSFTTTTLWLDEVMACHSFRWSLKQKIKARHNNYIATLAASATATALCVTDRAGEQPRPLFKFGHTDFDLQPNSHTQL